MNENGYIISFLKDGFGEMVVIWPPCCSPGDFFYTGPYETTCLFKSHKYRGRTSSVSILKDVISN